MANLPHIRKSTAPLKVLLADDHIRILESVMKLLDPDGYVVACASNGDLAVAVAQELCPDLVVLDIEMPGMDGIRAAREMRRLGLKANILFLTVHPDEEYIAAARKLGNGYILKSRMATDLRHAIHEAMAGRFFVSKHILDAG